MVPGLRRILAGSAINYLATWHTQFMGIVSLSGHLICANQSEADAVVELLPEHIRLTRQEPGCLSFQVTPAQDPWTWIVAERFTDAQAFEAHQQRVSSSHWGQGTAGIKREYRIEGL